MVYSDRSKLCWQRFDGTYAIADIEPVYGTDKRLFAFFFVTPLKLVATTFVIVHHYTAVHHTFDRKLQEIIPIIVTWYESLGFLFSII